MAGAGGKGEVVTRLMTKVEELQERIEHLEGVAESKSPAGITVSQLKRLREVATGDVLWVDAKEHEKLRLERDRLLRVVKKLQEPLEKKWWQVWRKS